MLKKHLLGKHNQKTHGRPGATDLSQVHHYTREFIGNDTIEVTDKKGVVKKRVIPQFSFKDSQTGEVVTDPVLIKQLRSSAGPNVTGVLINADPNADIRATWIDKKGQKQAVYGRAHNRESAGTKFTRIKEFQTAIRGIRTKMHRDMGSPNPKIAEAALILYLIDNTGFRPGGRIAENNKADVQAYGATTLLGKHVTISGNKLTFDFIGKKGVRNHKTITNKILAEEIGKRKTSNWSQPLFSISAGRLRDYVHSLDPRFDTKDFRTLRGTSMAIDEVAKRIGPATSERQFSRWQKEVASKVAKELGNTISVSLSNYIDFSVWDAWRDPSWGSWMPKKLKETSEE